MEVLVGTREGSHRRCRGAGVVFGREGSHAFDFRSTARNADVSWHEEEFPQATPWGRSGVEVTLSTFGQSSSFEAISHEGAKNALIVS